MKKYITKPLLILSVGFLSAFLLFLTGTAIFENGMKDRMLEKQREQLEQLYSRESGLNNGLLRQTGGIAETAHGKAYIRLFDEESFLNRNGIESTDPPGPLLEIEMAPEAPFIQYKQVTFVLTPGEEIDGWTLDIGRSITNDGWSGDAGSNKLDSELQIYRNTLSVFANDYGSSVEILREDGSFWNRKGVLVPGRELLIMISHNSVAIQPAGEEPLIIRNPNLFAFDTEAPEGELNPGYLYAAFGRVIAPFRTDRIGSGIDKAEIILNYRKEPSPLTYVAYAMTPEKKRGLTLHLSPISADRLPANHSWHTLALPDAGGTLWLAAENGSSLKDLLAGDRITLKSIKRLNGGEVSCSLVDGEWP